MKLILTNIAIQLKVLLYISALISLFYIGLMLGEYRGLKQDCLIDKKNCDISNAVKQGSIINFNLIKNTNAK